MMLMTAKILVSLAGAAVLVSAPPAPTSSQMEAAAALIRPAVVEVFGCPAMRLQSDCLDQAGTAFFVDSRGYLLTSNHVVEPGDYFYFIKLDESSSYPAEIVARDIEHDLALLKIPGQGYPALLMAEPQSLKAGDPVWTLGNAFGIFGDFLSWGVVEKPLLRSDKFSAPAAISQTLMQTSMQLYPGHSGGPTLDRHGRVVGINEAVAANAFNVSFSVPAESAAALIRLIP